MTLHWINLHFGLRSAGAAIAEVFGMVYLHQHGMSYAVIFLSYACLHLLRLALRPAAVRLMARMPFRTSLVAGTLLYAASYVILSRVGGDGRMLAFYIVWQAVSEIFYWTSYNACFALVSRKASRGRDIGMKEGLVTIARAAAPALGGLAITYTGFTSSFLAAAAVTLLAGAPALLLPAFRQARVPLRDAWNRSDRRAFAAHLGHGWYEAGSSAVWPLIVFLIVKSYTVAGVLASLVMVFQVVAYWVVGSHVDRGNGRHVAHIALGLLALGIAGRALVGNIAGIIALDAVFALALCFYSPALDTILFNAAEEAPGMWEYQILSETSVDLGYMLTFLIGALIAYLGGDLRWILVWSLGGVAVMLRAFRSYYPAPSPHRAPVLPNES